MDRRSGYIQAAQRGAIQAQEAVRWLSRALVDLDEDTLEVAAAIVDALGRMLALHVFADVARTPTDELAT